MVNGIFVGGGGYRRILLLQNFYHPLVYTQQRNFHVLEKNFVFWRWKRLKWKWKWSHSVVSYFWDPMDCSLPGFSVHGIFQARVLEWVATSFSRGSSWPRDQTQVSCIASRHFTLWATREAPKNTGVGSHSLLQGIFPTLESNLGLLHCKQIL